MNSTGSFVRWQNITIQQLSFVNNLFIGLSTGVLTLEMNIALTPKTTWSNILLWYSLVFLFVSLGLGSATALNRLKDFRLTTQVARKREKGELACIEDLKEKTDALGKKTWVLLKLQIVFFGLGTLFMLLIATIRLVV